jgi:hypothetical protein
MFGFGDGRHNLASSTYHSISFAFGCMLRKRFRTDVSLAAQQQVVWKIHKKLQRRKGNSVERQSFRITTVMDNNILFSDSPSEDHYGPDNSLRNSGWREHIYHQVANFQKTVAFELMQIHKISNAKLGTLRAIQGTNRASSIKEPDDYL